MNKKQENSYPVNVSKFKHITNPNFTHIYVNNACFIVSRYDVSITLGQLITTQSGEGVIEDKSTIVMSLEHANKMILILKDLLNKHESQYGPIRGERIR